MNDAAAATAMNKPADKKLHRYSIYVVSIALLIFFVYFALLADAFYDEGAGDQNLRLAQMTPMLPVKTTKIEQPAEITISNPINGMVANSGRVSVSGTAPDGSLVAIYLNGTLIESTYAHKGVYGFSDVPLPRRANVLRTRFYSSEGSSRYSAPILILSSTQQTQ